MSHTEDTRADYAEHRPTVAAADHDEARERFGGLNLGAAFFGWLVAIGVAVILTGILGAAVAAAGSSVNISQTEAQRQAGTIGLAAGIVLVAVLVVAYYAGGYVAGRMSRFDGGRQGLGVWVIGLLVTILAVIVGVVFGAQYNILDRVSLPRIPVPTDQVTTGGIVTALVLLLGTLLAAMLGGKVGRRYHHRVDRAGYR
jgi:hypothetical protein